MSFAVSSSELDKTYVWQENVCNVKLYFFLEFYPFQDLEFYPLGGRSWRLYLFKFLSLFIKIIELW